MEKVEMFWEKRKDKDNKSRMDVIKSKWLQKKEERKIKILKVCID